MGPQEILNEAVRRTLDGSRICPTNLSFTKFISGVMRSIAAELRNRTSGFTANFALCAGGPDALAVPDPAPRPDEITANARQVAALMNLFIDRPEAQIMLEGQMNGFTAQEIRSAVGLNAVSYASIRRLIRRRIDNAVAAGLL
jgi:hypothetical protein